jgi:hypothetical protein
MLRFVRAGIVAVEQEDVQEHIRTIFSFYELLIDLCPNSTLQEYARTMSRSSAFQIRIHPRIRVTDWSVPRDIWPRLGQAIVKRDLIAAQLAFQELHSLPDNADLPPRSFWDHGEQEQ